MEKLAVLDIKDAEYFSSQGYEDQHLGAYLFAFDDEVMNWLLNHDKVNDIGCGQHGLNI
mgnify:CR=1 FL=1